MPRFACCETDCRDDDDVELTTIEEIDAAWAATKYVDKLIERHADHDYATEFDVTVWEVVDGLLTKRSSRFEVDVECVPSASLARPFISIP